MKKTKAVLIFLAAFNFMIFTGCNGSKKSEQTEKTEAAVEEGKTDESKQSDGAEQSDEAESEVEKEEAEVVRNYYDNSAILALLTDKSITPAHTDAHKKYLKDEMKFSDYDLQGFAPDDYVRLVASNECQFYSADQFEVKDVEDVDYYKYIIIRDFDNLHGESIPIGTMIPGEKIEYRCPLAEGKADYASYLNSYYLWGCSNYFYKTTWKGKEGFVFGADLSYAGAANDVALYAEKYRKNGILNNFYPVEGYRDLTPEVQASLLKNKLAFEATYESGKYLETDELISHYQYMVKEKQTPVFITTDLAAHTQHSVFDSMLQRAEETYFVPRLLSVTQNFIAALQARTDVSDEIKTKAIEYFQVPELILRSTPTTKENDEWPYDTLYIPTDNSSFIGEYSEAVQKDYKQIMEASGECSNIFTFNIDGEKRQVEEDFTQYKPRGHYTKNGILETYFRAEMWYGRIHFCIAKSGYNGVSDWETSVMEPIAMFIVDTVKANPELYEQWANLFDPITELIGLSDDLGFNEVLPLWKDQNVSDFNKWASDSKKLADFVKLCHEKLRPPAISGNSSWTGAVEGDSLENSVPPMGWRFLGQRFTWDSYVHEKVSAPRLMPRDYVRGLDIMKAFGSNAAEQLFVASDYRNDLKESDGPSYYGGTELKKILNNLKKEFDKKPEEFWTETYYNTVLAQIKTQATFENGTGYYFTESPMWNIKALNSACSTWAELRHDTILYVKQVYGERAGGDDWELTYRIEPLPAPINYIEPNLPFWTYSILFMANLADVFKKYDLYNEETDKQIQQLTEFYKKALDICQKEAKDEPISKTENDWIRTIPYICGAVYNLNYSNSKTEDSNKAACIADVYTNCDYGQVLEVGVERPLKVYIPLNDGQGGKRIAIGYVPSYCEFYHPQDDRMTDEQWKQIVYEDNKTDISEYYPFWKQGCVIRK